MVWAVIGIVVAIMAVAIYFALKAHNKLVAEGKIISRRTDFMENAEEFTLAAVDPSQVTDSVKAFDYNGMRVAMKGNSSMKTTCRLLGFAFIFSSKRSLSKSKAVIQSFNAPCVLIP